MIGLPIGSGSISVSSVTLRGIIRLSIKPLRDIGISRCDKVNNRAVIRPRSLFKIIFNKFVRKISNVI